MATTTNLKFKVKFGEILLAVFFAIFLFETNAQVVPCSVNLSYTTVPTPLTCNGGNVSLVAVGAGAQNTLMSNDFNAGLGSGWVATGGSSVGSPCGPSQDGTPYYWASTAVGTPNLTTVAYDVSCGGVLEWDMAYSTQGGASPCEGPDLPNEGVYLQYSTNGGATWITIQYWDPVGGYDPTLTSWNQYGVPIPAGAMTPNTQFRWIQTSSSGSCCDNWGIDNVYITANAGCNSYWYNYTTVPGWNNPPNYSTSITSTSTIGVWYTDGSTDSCYAEVTVVVPPGPTANAGPDQLICGGSGSAVIGANPVTATNGATYSWTSGAGSGTIDLVAPGIVNGQVTVSPATTTNYTLSVTSAGCTTTDQVTVTVDAPPTASNPAPINVQCASAIPAPNVNVVTDEADDYTVPPTVTYIGEAVTTPGCPEVRTRTYRVTDGCGSFVDVFQTITIDPTTNPVVPANGGSIVNCVANALVQPAAPAVTDVCGNALTPVVTAPAAIPCEGNMVWTFTYTDCSGNSSVWNYTYTIDQPGFTVPANGGSTVNCPANANVQPAAPVVTDACGNVLAPVVVAPAVIACEGTMVWQFNYTDCAGNNAQWLYTYTIDRPAFVVPANGGSTVNCPANANVQPAAPIVNDACGNVLAPVVVAPAVIACEGTMVWQFNYTDCAGNTAQWLYTYTIDRPAFAVPANGGSTVNCPANANIQPAAPIVNDACGNVLAPVVVAPAVIACEGTMVWQFNYTDCAGNTAQWLYTYTIDMPAFTLPANAGSTVNCLANVTVPVPPAMNDICGNAIAPVMNQNADPACEGNKIFTFTYTDCAGNTADWVYTYTIDIPTFTLPANGSESVVCIGDVYVPVPPVMNDMCGNALVPVMSQNADPVCVGDKIYTFTYTDCAGNTADWTYTFSINDNVNPTGTAPADISITSMDPIPPADPTLITDEADNCGTVPTVTHVIDVSDGGSCPEIITRTYQIEDACGNITLVDQIISIVDIGPPTASNPAPLVVECMADVPAPNPAVVTDEADESGIQSVLWESDTPAGSCPTVIDRVYRVTDNCGNFIFVTQTITVIPSTNPVVPANGASTVNCLVDAQVQPVAPVVTDVCGNNIVPVVTVPANIVCEGDMTWIFTYTDCAGNSSVWNYTYTVDLPTFTLPANQSEAVVCFADIYVPTPPVMTDLCGNNLVPVMSQGPDPVCVGDKVYTFTYTDCAGNTAVWTYTFSINDNVNPTASNPAPISVPGSTFVPAPDITVVIDEADNCTLNPTVAWVSDVSDGNVCNNEVITRTYSVTDDCGNSITVTQLITITAVPAPIDAGPDTLICADGFATLTADNPWGVAIAWDNGINDGQAFSPSGTTVYTVTANNYGCISTDNVTVNVEDLPTVAFTADVLAGCEPLTTTFTNNSVGGSPLINCIWDFGNGVTAAGCGQVTYTYPIGGLYDVTLTTTSATGCVNTATYQDYIYVENIPVASFNASSTYLTTIDTEVDFTNTSVDATTYLWNFGDGTQSTTEESPTHTFPFDDPGNYTVELIATSPLGCVDTVTRVIVVVEETIFYVPNTFTPDGDNYNEFFTPVFTSGYDPYDFTLLIFNRWGEIVWESHDASVGWDGTYGGNIVQDGTYTWTIEFKTTQNDKRMFVEGHVNIIR